MKGRRFVAALGAITLAACSGNLERRVRELEVPVVLTPTPSASVSARPIAAQPKGDPKVDAEIRRVLERVAAIRELPILKPVHGRSLGRDALLVNLKKKAKEELPPEVLAQQGEAYRALELVPLDYDFEAGLLKVLQSAIAGYYDSDDKMMYLIDDLDDDYKAITLNHELVHALQDESFDLAPLTKYRPGKGDEDSAVQALIEGDAVNGMFDAAGNPAMKLDASEISDSFRHSMASSDTAASAPVFIRDSLVAPYADGFAFVHYLRKEGGWAAVDEAFRHRPTTTEQVLHPQKFIELEPADAIPEPPIDALGKGFQSVMVDTMGEAGFRFMLHAKGADFAAAAKSADGWGGDRWVLAQRKADDGSSEWAFALHLRMDDAPSAKEIADALSTYLAKAVGASACTERATLGPLAWAQKGLDLAIVAGPYKAVGPARTTASTCADARAWISAILPP
ncbi:MAG: hypothetical protein U0414_37900 [Polyangiaceae bacterium]